MDVLTPEQRRKNMQHIKSKDTSIEVKLRTALWHAGIRYRKNYVKLPGTPDIAITKYKIAVFCDSSFWHGRDLENGRVPKTRTEYWTQKIRRTMERDRETDKTLRNMEWKVLRFWDDEIKKNLEECVKAVQEAIQDTKLPYDDFLLYDDGDN